MVLRPYAQADLGLVCAASADPVIPSITSVPRTYSDEAGRAFIDRQHQRAIDGDGYSFVIAEPHAPELAIGSIGLWLHEIESGRASVGYWLVAPARGRGLAARRAAHARRVRLRRSRVPRVHLFVEPWNVASARTAVAAGFRHEATLKGWERIDGEQRDADCFALLRTEWAPG